MEKAKILALLLSFLLTSCYEKYTMDYEHTAAYVAYQYDLRTFVIGEGMKFNFTVALGGVVKNTHDRSVQVVIDDALLTDDLLLRKGDGSFHCPRRPTRESPIR